MYEKGFKGKDYTLKFPVKRWAKFIDKNNFLLQQKCLNEGKCIAVNA